MKSDDQEKAGEGPKTADWMKSAMDFWLSGAGMWPGMSSSRQDSDAQTTGQNDFKTRSQEAWEKPFKVFESLFSNFSDAEGLSAFITGTGALPDMMMRMLRSGYDGYSKLYQQWLEKLGKVGESGEPYRFENLDEDLFKGLMDIYVKEIQPILNAPQLGLNRLYQERVFQTLDKYNLYQGSLGEFMRLLFLPVEKSLRVMEKEIERLGAEGKLSENFNDYYRMWIKILEGHYMTLLKSPDYLDSLVRTLNTVQDFKMAQHKMLADMLQSLPIPTNKEMDELYKEIYLLKKKVKQLSSKVETPNLSA
jgi:polyhydroxyalkanoate synthesis regulator phasin